MTNEKEQTQQDALLIAGKSVPFDVGCDESSMQEMIDLAVSQYPIKIFVQYANGVGGIMSWILRIMKLTEVQDTFHQSSSLVISSLIKMTDGQQDIPLNLLF